MTLAALETPPVPRTPAAGGRRWLRWTALGLLACALLGVVLFERWAGAYQPLQRGSLTQPGLHTRIVSGVGSNKEVYFLPPNPGERQVVLLTVANRGQHAVTLDGVDLDDSVMFFGIRAVEPVAMKRSGELAGTTRFPYRLEPGREMALRLTFALRDCDVGIGQTVSFDGVPVRWHAFGRHHLTQVDEPIIAMELGHPDPRFRLPCPEDAPS